MALSRKRSAPPTLSEGGAALLHAGQAAAPRSAEVRQPVLQVVDLQRFALDSQFFDQTGEVHHPECGDAFDVTLSDGRLKIKCLLTTVLNPLVYQGWLQRHSVVRVESWRNVKDELDIDGASPPIVVLTRLETRMSGDGPTVLAGPISDPGASLRWLPAVLPPDGEAETALTQPRPLFGVRQHYLRPDSNEVLLTSDWAAHECASAPPLYPCASPLRRVV